MSGMKLFRTYKSLDELYIETEEAECEEDFANNEFVLQENVVGHT